MAQRDGQRAHGGGARSAAAQQALLAARHRNYESLSARSPDGFDEGGAGVEEPDLAPDALAAEDDLAAELDGGALPGSVLLDAPDDGAAWPGGVAADAVEYSSMPAKSAAYMGIAGLQRSLI